MPRVNPNIARQTPDDGCTPLSCRDCGIYRLCHAEEGEVDVDIQLLDGIVKGKRSLKRGETLFRAGEPFRNVYAVRYGSVKTAVVSKDGRVQITGFHISGELLGLSAIASGCYSCEAIALEATSVCEVPFERFRDLSRQFPTLQYEMLYILSREIQHDQELMLLLGKKNARERLATYLLNLSAYSTANLPLIPEQACHPFQAKAATDSRAKLPTLAACLREHFGAADAG